MNPAQILDRAHKAKAVLENPAYTEAYEMCRLAIIDRIEKCPLSDTTTAEDLRKCLKLLRDVQANMVHAFNSGKIEEFKLTQAEKVSKNPFRGLFR